MFAAWQERVRVEANMAVRPAALLAATAFLLIGWASPQTLEAAPQRPVTDSCLQADLRSLSPEQRQAVSEALVVVCDVYRSEAFKDRLESRDWLAGCTIAFWAPRNRISGPDAYRALRRDLPGFTVAARAHPNANVMAETDLETRTITLRPSRIRDWGSTHRPQRGELAVTLAHELTHLIKDENNEQQFTDSGFKLPWCGAENLVSYAVENFARQRWQEAEAR